MMHRSAGLPALLLLLFVAGCQTSGAVRQADVTVHSDDTLVRVIFTDRDRALIRDFYHRHPPGKHRKTPPGLAKKDRPPPGLERQYRRYGRIPPGLQGRYLPVDLERRLSRLPDGYVRVRIDTDLVLMRRDTRVVLDIIYDIAR